MKRLFSLILCMALILGCMPAQASSFADLLGLPSPTPEAEKAEIPDLAATLGSMPLRRGSEDAPEEFPGDVVQFDFPDEAQTLAGAERFFDAMIERGYAASAMTIEGVNCILLEQDQARVLLVPVAASGRVTIILGGNARYAENVAWNTEADSIPRPNFAETMGARGVPEGSEDTEWGFAMDFFRLTFQSEREVVAATNRLDVALKGLGYEKAIALFEDIWSDMYTLDGAHILVATIGANVFIGVEQDKPFAEVNRFAVPTAPPTAAPTAVLTIAPTTAPIAQPTAAAPTLIPGSQTLPSFGAYLGWAPTLKEYFYTDSNGMEYWMEVYCGYDDEIRRAYLALLKEPRFGLTAIEDDYYVQGENGMINSSAFVYTGPIELSPPAMPLESGGTYHVYLASSEADDIFFTFFYPKALTPADYGDRSPYYGMLIQPTPRPAQSTGQGGGNSGGGQSNRGNCGGCDGTGAHRYCNGSGYVYTFQGKQECSGCNGTGKCWLCNGRGWI